MEKEKDYFLNIFIRKDKIAIQIMIMFSHVFDGGAEKVSNIFTEIN